MSMFSQVEFLDVDCLPELENLTANVVMWDIRNLCDGVASHFLDGIPVLRTISAGEAAILR